MFSRLYIHAKKRDVCGGSSRVEDRGWFCDARSCMASAPPPVSHRKREREGGGALVRRVGRRFNRVLLGEAHVRENRRSQKEKKSPHSSPSLIPIVFPLFFSFMKIKIIKSDKLPTVLFLFASCFRTAHTHRPHRSPSFMTDKRASSTTDTPRLDNGPTYYCLSFGLFFTGSFRRASHLAELTDVTPPPPFSISLHFA